MACCVGGKPGILDRASSWTTPVTAALHFVAGIVVGVALLIFWAIGEDIAQRRAFGK